MRGIFLQIITLSSLSLMEDCLRGPELLTPVVSRPGLDILTGDHYQGLLTIGHYIHLQCQAMAEMLSVSGGFLLSHRFLGVETLCVIVHNHYWRRIARAVLA